MNRLKEIDGLRAIAVLAVIVYHYKNEWAPRGYFGVDIFFVISGYVITKSILEEMDVQTFTFNGFFLRRAKRLLPGLALVIVMTLVASSVLLPGKGTYVAGIAALFGLSNIWFWYSGSDYFSASTDWNPLMHTWSLGVEEQFYMFFPFLLAAHFNRTKRLVWAICVIGLASMIAYFSVWFQNPISAFYLSPLRLWELVAGTLVFVVHRSCGHPRTTGAIQLQKYGAIAVMLYLTFSPHVTEVTGTLLVVATACLLLYLIGKTDQENFLLGNRASQYIGRISYSLYLWHWPAAVFLKMTLPSHLILPSYVLVTGLLSAASFQFVECPLRQRSWAVVNERFLGAFAAYSAVVLAAWGMLYFARPHLYVGEVERQEAQFLRHNACHIPGANGLELCLKRSDADRRMVWLVGDSHAGNFALGLSKAAGQLSAGFNFVTGRSLFKSLSGQCFSSFECPEGDHKELTRRLEAVSKRGDVVVIAFARDRFHLGSPSVDTFSLNLIDFVTTLRSLELTVVLVEDIPKVCSDDGEFVKSTFQASVCRISTEESKQSRDLLSRIYRGVMQQVNVKIIDPHDLLCRSSPGGPAECSNYLDSRLIYLDSSPHLTESASRNLSGFFVEALRGPLHQ